MLWATGEGDMEESSHSLLLSWVGLSCQMERLCWEEEGGTGRQGFATLRRATGLPGRTSVRT